MALSAVDAISPAFNRMKRQLFQPFRFAQWIRYAVVGFLAGEVSTAGGCNLRLPFGSSSQRAGEFQLQAPMAARGLLMTAGVAVLVILALVAIVTLLYVSSRMRFVLFDSVIAGECQIARFWSRRGGPALRFFVWQILFGFVLLGIVALLLGGPLAVAFSLGLLRNPRAHLALFILGALVIGLVLLAVVFSAAGVYVLAKDFVVPQIALENVTATQGWQQLWTMMKAEPGSYAGYIGMKVLLSVAAFVIVGVALFIVLLVPILVTGALLVIGTRSAVLTWNPFTIALAIVFGVILLAALLTIAGLASAPAIVFFPAFSMYFFADRYAPLRAALFPAQELQ
jgi:hypothetical protein